MLSDAVMPAATAVFWVTLCLCAGTYLVYPAALWVLNLLIPAAVRRGEVFPNVSILIAAYNEAKHLEQKITNTLSLGYPRERMEIWVGSDGSSDATAEIAGRFAPSGIRVLRCPINRGKTAVQNDLVAASSGEILVFTDAASFLPEDALRKLVRAFADERVGCVAGRMVFLDAGRNINTQSQGLYWRYESRLRALESGIGSLIGVDGPLYAVRRSCYVALPNEVISDFVTPLLVLRQGRDVVLEEEAVVAEEPTQRSGQEFATRRRITLRGLVALRIYKELLNPLKRPLLALQILFHKVVRWCVGPLLVLNFLSCVLLAGRSWFALMLAAYLVLGAAALSGWMISHAGKSNRLLAAPFYFMLVNAAATSGIIDFFLKRKAVAWKPVR